ncbi:hypothetical protein CBR_g34210 [Chara braunii]|uniref:Uncharacterized protein n=1 Tax=Chara braunii TaxID=69332 RepID=A0A388LI80_CHABU|nr:hypothetical protein CBR_g34210 [Chara braunii]|eukprot:GBG82030.1 hypothetical protein CBR_g34210 [Chara braunii]
MDADDVMILSVLASFAASLCMLIGGTLLAIGGAAKCDGFLFLPSMLIGIVLCLNPVFVVVLGGDSPRGKQGRLFYANLTVFALSILLLLSLAIFAFRVSEEGVSESDWLQERYRSNATWGKIRRCLWFNRGVCKRFMKHPGNFSEYENKTLADLDDDFKLTAMEASCCKPPAGCGFARTLDTATFIRMSNMSTASQASDATMLTEEDCSLFKNSANARCFDCLSCKAEFLHTVKRQWRRWAAMCLPYAIILLMSYGCFCMARLQ